MRILIGNKIYLRASTPDDYLEIHRWFNASDPQLQTCHPARVISPEERVKRMEKKETPEKVTEKGKQEKRNTKRGNPEKDTDEGNRQRKTEMGKPVKVNGEDNPGKGKQIKGKPGKRDVEEGKYDVAYNMSKPLTRNHISCSKNALKLAYTPTAM